MMNSEIIVLKNEKSFSNKNYQNGVGFFNIQNIFISSILAFSTIIIIQFITILDLKKYKNNCFQKNIKTIIIV